MVYSAADNALAPVMVSQLKALKDARRHRDVNVLVYVDPNEKGVPTRIYCVNQAEPYRERSARDAWVRNLNADAVDLESIRNASARDLRKALKHPDGLEAKPALTKFLSFCRENYRARHYILLLVGHGMIVGNDAFLPDESPISAITLKDLGTLLRGFGGRLELLALHSCSMSAIEVAYELRGKAKYMIASEGLSFVQGWPYRQLLNRITSLLDEARNDDATPSRRYVGFDVQDMVERLYFLSYYNGYDFMLSGYSQDLTLLNLDADFDGLTKAVKKLVLELKKGLRATNEQAKRLIQLAHLESQSYFSENYTDLYDFCFCLAESCKTGPFRTLREACEDVMTVLEPNNSREREERFSKVVVHSKHFGSHYQYSHGLSIYFPWSEPLGDQNNDPLEKYKDYEFTTDLGKQNWRSFLTLYLDKTKREARKDIVTNGAVKRMFAGMPGALDAEVEHKPTGGSGVGCNCPSIKNFPTEVREIKGKKKTVPKFAMTRKLQHEEQ